MNPAEGIITSINQSLGIKDEEIYGLFQDDRESLWLGTSSSIVTFFRKKTAQRKLSVEGKSSFQATGAPSFEPEENIPFAALIRGVQGIEKESTFFGGTSFEHEGGVPTLSESPLTHLTLEYEDNALRFLFTANDFYSPETVQFQTYLKGMEEGWSKWSKRPFREYTNLIWHEYTFFVRALRSDGTQSEASSFTFRILPPWYETWWFYASQVGFLLFLLLIAGILRGYGWGENLSDYIVAVVVLVLFVYLDTQTEVYIEGFAEDVLYIKVLLMIAMGIMIEPMQGMAKRGFAKIHLGGDVLTRRHRDELTGLGDRVYFNKKMGRAIAKALKQPRPISMVMLDFDHFKNVNDQHGLECGDEMLVQLAQILMKNAREGDIVARYMGEKFIIGLFDLSTGVTVRVCERIRKDIETHEFRFEDLSLRLRASFGAACFPDVCADNLSLEALLHEVDAALSEAKARGRNQTVAAPVIQSRNATEALPGETSRLS